MRIGRCVLFGNLLLLALSASCSSGRDENALAATDLGRFQAPPGSSLLHKSYSSQHTSAEGVTDCAEYARVFGTNDVDGFQHAVFETARTAHWSADQSEAPSALDGMSDIFRGDREVAQLSFWSKPKPNDRSIYQRWSGPHAMTGASIDWSVYRFAAVLQVFDGNFARCRSQTHGGVMRVVGRVTSSESGLPIAGVKVRLYQQFPNGRNDPAQVAKTDDDGRYTFDVADKYPVRGVSFDGGPDYLMTWWRDATSLETATELTRSTRNVVFAGIDAKLQRVLP